jgi:hypothetical protein
MFRPTFPIPFDLIADALGGHEGLFAGLPAGRRFLEAAVPPPSVEMFAPAPDEVERNEAMDRLFGRTQIASRCRDDRTWSGSLPLYSSNAFAELIAKSVRLKTLLADGRSPEQIAEELFLAALSRRPRPEELKAVLNYVKEYRDAGKKREELWRDLLWALFNTREFIMRR